MECGHVKEGTLFVMYWATSCVSVLIDIVDQRVDFTFPESPCKFGDRGLYLMMESLERNVICIVKPKAIKRKLTEHVS